jgi:hypothetical protein
LVNRGKYDNSSAFRISAQIQNLAHRPRTPVTDLPNAKTILQARVMNHLRCEK